MFQFIGYHPFSGPDALNSAPSQVDNITTTTLTNAIFDHFNVTKKTDLEFNTTIPVDWDYDTIMNVDFDGNINAGNVDFLIDQISGVKIKRRIKGTFDWITLETVPISKVEDLNFLFIDRLNACNVEYEYALVPILNDIEGDYIINQILSKFNGVFIGDFDSIYKFLYDVQYGSNARNQQVGTFMPLGRQYPIIVANGLTSYESGTVTATILNDDFTETHMINPTAIVEKKEILKNFLTNKKAKILKDWNGNFWLCFIVDNVQMTYKNGSGMAVPQIQFSWTQIGDGTSQQDLYMNGILDEPG